MTAMSVALALMMFAGCQKDEDGKNSGRDAFVGTYRETCTVRYWDGSEDTDHYNITITLSSANKNDIIITNILNEGAGVSVIAKVDGESFTIAQQTITIEGVGAGISGSGRRSGNTLHYSVMGSVTGIGQASFTCDAVKL